MLQKCPTGRHSSFQSKFPAKCRNIPQELNLLHLNSQSCRNRDKPGRILVAAEVGVVDKMVKKWPFTSLVVLTAHLAVFDCFWMLFCWKKCWSLAWVTETCFFLCSYFHFRPQIQVVTGIVVKWYQSVANGLGIMFITIVFLSWPCLTLHKQNNFVCSFSACGVKVT